MRRLVVGTRGSALALQQANQLVHQIKSFHPKVTIETQIIKTTGDKMSSSSLTRLAGDTKGLFVKEIEEALLEGTIDLAVHSLKDVPTTLPAGLELGVVPEREDPRDCLITSDACQSLSQLPAGCRIGTSSLRRTVQLRYLRDDLEVLPIRGNIDTRIRKMREGQFDAIVLALAGLKRMGLEKIASYVFPLDELVPAVGQGALAVETRVNDQEVHARISHLEHDVSRETITAERAFLLSMGGGCQVPMGAHAQIRGATATFSVFFSTLTGEEMTSRTMTGPREDLEEMAAEAASSLRKLGTPTLAKDSGAKQSG